MARTQYVQVVGTDAPWRRALDLEPFEPLAATVDVQVDVGAVPEGAEPDARLVIERVERRMVWQVALAMQTGLTMGGFPCSVEVAGAGGVGNGAATGRPPLRLELAVPGEPDPQALRALVRRALSAVLRPGPAAAAPIIAPPVAPSLAAPAPTVPTAPNEAPGAVPDAPPPAPATMASGPDDGARAPEPVLPPAPPARRSRARTAPPSRPDSAHPKVPAAPTETTPRGRRPRQRRGQPVPTPPVTVGEPRLVSTGGPPIPAGDDPWVAAEPWGPPAAAWPAAAARGPSARPTAPTAVAYAPPPPPVPSGALPTPAAPSEVSFAPPAPPAPPATRIDRTPPYTPWSRAGAATFPRPGGQRSGGAAPPAAAAMPGARRGGGRPSGGAFQQGVRPGTWTGIMPVPVPPVATRPGGIFIPQRASFRFGRPGG